MCSLESRVLKALGIAIDEIPTVGASNTATTTAVGQTSLQSNAVKATVNGSIKYSQNTNVGNFNSGSKRPSNDSILDKLRAAGIAFTTRVEVIISPPFDKENEYQGNKKWGGKRKGNSFSNNSSGKSKFKKRKKGAGSDESDNDDDGEVVTKQSNTDILLEGSTKLYFKVDAARHRYSPQGAASAIHYSFRYNVLIAGGLRMASVLLIDCII
jgi:hypothetical protein